MDNNNALVQVGKAELVKGGLGFGSNSGLFKLQPANIQLTQKMTQGEGVIPGKLRIKETGQMFNEMQIVLLFEPVTRRSYFEGDDFSADNQLCFSMDNVQPHSKAKVPQAMFCNGCPKGSWDKYNQTQAAIDKPKCRPYYRCMVADRLTQMPYFLDVRGSSIQPFRAACQNLVRMIAQLQSQGQNPNLFDFSFTMYPVSQKNGQYYTLGFKNFAPIAPEDREKFGNIYIEFANRWTLPQEEVQAQEEAQALEAEIVQPGSETEPIDGEIVI